MTQKSQRPSLSVITIVFNDREHIARTIESVNSQSARDAIEYIVVDGASNDGTTDIIRSHSYAIDLHICEPDTGIYNAMNKGLAAATGEYVIFMNSGDGFTTSDAVARILQAIAHSGRRPALIYGDYRESRTGTHTSGSIPARNPDKIWYGPVASHQSTFYNLNFLHSHGLHYDESYRIAADYKLTMQTLVTSHYDAIRTDICVSDFDTSGVSNGNMDKGLSEANRARREVLGWGALRCSMLTALLLSARYAKKYMRPIYNYLRRR